MYDHLFDAQDYFGLKPWRDYASDAGVMDLGLFDECVKRTDTVARIEEGKELGTKLDIRGTPTVIVNGWMLGRTPTDGELDTIVKSVLSGKSPLF